MNIPNYRRKPFTIEEITYYRRKTLIIEGNPLHKRKSLTIDDIPDYRRKSFTVREIISIMQGIIVLCEEIHYYLMISFIIKVFDVIFNDLRTRTYTPHIHPAHTSRTYTAHAPHMHPHIHIRTYIKSVKSGTIIVSAPYMYICILLYVYDSSICLYTCTYVSTC